jgi:hypothetical protein
VETGCRCCPGRRSGGQLVPRDGDVRQPAAFVFVTMARDITDVQLPKCFDQLGGTRRAWVECPDITNEISLIA